MKTIVVGVDGSADSVRALRWAVAEAGLRDAEVLVLHAWTYPMVVGGYEALIPLPDSVDVVKEATERLERVVAAATGGEAPVKIRTEVRQGAAATVLIEASNGADLLVVGSRGMGGFRELLLGSVSHQCAHHARCPVVVVPHQAEES